MENKKATFAGGFDYYKKRSAFRSWLLLRLRSGGLPLDIFLTACLLDRFVVLLAHSSLHWLGIPIWCEIL